MIDRLRRAAGRRLHASNETIIATDIRINHGPDEREPHTNEAS